MTMPVPHDVMTAAEPHQQEEEACPGPVVEDVLYVHGVCPCIVAVRDRRCLSQHMFQQRHGTEDRKHGNDQPNQSHAIHHRKHSPSAFVPSSPGTVAAKAGGAIGSNIAVR